MTDADVLREIGAIKRAYKAALTRVERKLAAEKKHAMSFFGSSDVEQAARHNAVLRAEAVYGNAVKAAMAKRQERLDALRARAGIWSDLVPNAADVWLYHETTSEAFPSIAAEGILPTSYGQFFVGDMGEVLSPDLFEEEELAEAPEEDLVPRTYVSKKQPEQLYYGEILLRFPRSAVKRVRRDVDWYITEPVPREVVEVMLDGLWLPLL